MAVRTVKKASHRSRTVLSIILSVASLLCFYGAIAIADFYQIAHENPTEPAKVAAPVQTQSPVSNSETEEERESLERLLGMGPGAVSPEAFAEARANALALPI